jgi:hypothetical protein
VADWCEQGLDLVLVQDEWELLGLVWLEPWGLWVRLEPQEQVFLE